VGWKYEVDGDRTSVVRAAERQLAECRTDACVTNGPAYGNGFGLLRSNGQSAHFGGAPELYAAIENLLHG
jgi:phosphopantothenoylcysteine decarboxylase/phosphopantothenate--cysteine ligase